jgi:hypothetical protein|tara:strand:- start:238 stop:786 length:549 start_codon:yes stop_codon:yes gene_type:complete
MSIRFNICYNFHISKLSCSCREGNNEEDIDPDEVEFILKESEKINFNDLIPSKEIYVYFKILKNEVIIAFTGDNLIEIPLQKEDLLNKKLSEIKIFPELFIDYIRPLFLNAIDRGEAYQFIFQTNITPRDIVCSIYPCSVPGIVTSCDIVLRYSHQNAICENPGQFILNSNIKKGEKVELLH